MKKNKLTPIIGLSICSGFLACNDNGSEDLKQTVLVEETTQDNSALSSDSGFQPQFSLSEPTKNAIYFLKDVDMSSYDSIGSSYIHEVLDYDSDSLIDLGKEKEKLTYYLNDHSIDFSNHQYDSILSRVNQISSELKKHKRAVQGYVFVHTFRSLEDTVSAIILINKKGTNSTAIKVKTLTEIQPELFRTQVRKINQ